MPPRRVLAVFPTFLAPSPPFPKRHHQQQHIQHDQIVAAGTARTTSLESPCTSPEENRGLKLTHPSYIRCARCGADICHTSQIISKGFTGRHGRAYLVAPTESPLTTISIGINTQKHTLPNTITQKAVPRQLVTGAHTVADINCIFCGSVLGWKYIAAEEEAQRYKVGKYIIETKRITTSSCWDFEDDLPSLSSSSSTMDGDDLSSFFGSSLSSPCTAAGSWNDDGGCCNDNEPELEFDSQDEDECEDLFTGVWTPGLARRRRSRKLNRK